MKLLGFNSRFIPFAVLALPLFAQTNTFPSSGNVGIGTTSPSYSLDVNGEAYVSGAFRIGELYFSSLQTISFATATERWVKLATIPNNHYVRFQLRNGSQNSEEIAEVKVFGTYHNSLTGISVERQTYNEHLREVRVVGSDGYPRTVYIKIRASDYAPSVVWRAIDSKGAIAIHNVEETPTGGLAHFVSGNLVTSTNTNFVTTGSVGIGTTNPLSKLEITGPTGSYSSGIGFVPAGTGAREYRTFINTDGSFNLNDATAGTTRLTINSSGYFGIGTTSPTQKLSVNGTIRAKEVIVDTGWSDYVFKPGYKLASLSEVEAHIEAYGHLPGVPSEAHVAKEGVSVGEMQSKLLAKLEEVTLHLIAQEKRMNLQSARIAALKTENAQLREEIHALRPAQP